MGSTSSPGADRQPEEQLSGNDAEPSIRRESFAGEFRADDDDAEREWNSGIGGGLPVAEIPAESVGGQIHALVGDDDGNDDRAISEWGSDPDADGGGETCFDGNSDHEHGTGFQHGAGQHGARQQCSCQHPISSKSGGGCGI